MTEKVDVALGFDGNYAPHAAAVVASASRYADHAPFRFIILYESVSAQQKSEIEALAPNSHFLWVAIGEEDVPAFEARGHFARSSLYRLGLEKLAPADCERLIYLDSDVTILGDIRELWREDLGDYAIGAVVDPYGACAYPDMPFAERWNLPPGEYFNAGILLIDLRRVRAERAFGRAMEFVAAHDLDLPFNGQDALNWVYWNKWRRLNVIWNAQRLHAADGGGASLPASMMLNGQAPKIVHYTGGEKPWLRIGYHPWSWIYWESLSHTPYLDTVARVQKVTGLMRLKLWLRWMRRRPPGAVLRKD